MGDHIANTDQDIRSMLEAIGASSVEELFAPVKKTQRPASFRLPQGLSEFEVLKKLQGTADKNDKNLLYFTGAGFYDHHIPSVVDHLSSRSEFYTAYTPYQPECSQGTLQAIYEYQSALCRLTGMEIANASLYDGGTALYEAVMMARRLTGRDRVLVDSAVSPIYRTMLTSYTKNLDISFVEIPVAHGRTDRAGLKKHLTQETACVIVQNPNFFGAIDDYSDIAAQARAVGAMAVASVYPVSLGMLKTPGEMGFDIVTGEGQSLGLPLSFGGPYLGFMTTKKDLARKMPGRVVGQTVDSKGQRGFVLTLQAREQHIRREKATSNICSNEALCALRAVIYLSALGKKGLAELAELNYQKAEYLKHLLSGVKGVEVKKSSPTFNEFAIVLPKNPDDVVAAMFEKGICAGFPLGRYYKEMDRYMIVAVTEKLSKDDLDYYAKTLESVLWG
ncbi:MAG: aminomethyl-transferring glycine dehydrogenase subunit GcvPA [Candidatus Omnitrophota bacterium]